MGKMMKFTFRGDGDLKGAEHDMTVSLLVAEFIHGKPRVRLEAGYDVAANEKSLSLRVAGPAGETAAQVFAGFCGIRFGEDGYSVERRLAGELLPDGQSLGKRARPRSSIPALSGGEA